jgi:hypothetical protein
MMSDIHDPPEVHDLPNPTPTNPDPHKGQFPKGHKPIVRRRHGSQNKITRDLKNGIVYGAAKHGSDGKGKGGLWGYLAMAAREYPKEYLKLLARLLPYTISADTKALGSCGIGNVTIVAAPSDLFLSAESIRALNGQEPLIEQPEVLIEQPEPEPEPEIGFFNITRMRRRNKGENRND